MILIIELLFFSFLNIKDVSRHQTSDLKDDIFYYMI